MSELPAPAPGKSPEQTVPNITRTDDVLGNALLDEADAEKRIDQIEMIGEEEVAGLHAPASAISPGMRYLHCSRTINQLVTDRNRAVGLYIAVASLLWTASSALLNAKPSGQLLVPIEAIQRWCLPATFGTLAVLAIFAGLLLVRTRVGLIYEVAKMNVLLGLPIGRVQRVNPLGIFFIMHALISVAGGCSAALLAFHLLYKPSAGTDGGTVAWSAVIGFVIAALLVYLYVGMVRYTTADQKLQRVQSPAADGQPLTATVK